MSEQKAVPEIPEDLREMYESSKLDTTMFVGSQIRQLIRRITNLEAELAELRATDHTVQMEETADAKAERKKYEALREENAALKAQVERLSAPVTDEEKERWYRIGFEDCRAQAMHVVDESDGYLSRVGGLEPTLTDPAFFAARTTPPAKEHK